MDLLVCIINREEELEEVLAGFLKLGITGATVVRSEGMGRVLAQAAPVMAGLQELSSRTRPRNTTILSVIESQDKLDSAIQMIQDRCGDLARPGTGIVFTVPVSRAVGLAAELDARSG